MATLIDVAGLEQFSKIFVFIVVILVVYAAFAATKTFGDKQWIAWIVAIVLGILVLLSNLATNLIRYVIPWFAIIAIFGIFIFMATKVFGASGDLGEHKTAIITVIVLAFIVGTAFYIRGQTAVPGDLDENGNVVKEKNYNTTMSFLFHPKIMGIIFVLLVAIFTVALLAGKAS